MYAYCNNNPVKNVDYGGEIGFAQAVFAGAFIGFVIGGGSSLITQLFSPSVLGDWSKVNWGEVAYDAGWGALSGILATSGISTPLSVVSGSIIGAISSIGKDLIFHGGNINGENAIVSAVLGGLSGLISGAGANYKPNGQQVTKFINSYNILDKTKANNTVSAIARQTDAMLKHAGELVVSGVKYLFGNVVSTVGQIVHSWFGYNEEAA